MSLSRSETLRIGLSRSQAAAQTPSQRGETLYPTLRVRKGLSRKETPEPQLSRSANPLPYSERSESQGESTGLSRSANPVSTGRNPLPYAKGTERARIGWQAVIALGLVGSAAIMSALNWLQPALFSTRAISGALLISVLLGIIIVTKSRHVF